MEELIEQLRQEGDSIGARVDVQATNVPVGIGDPVFDRLDADIAKGDYTLFIIFIIIFTFTQLIKMHIYISTTRKLEAEKCFQKF